MKTSGIDNSLVVLVSSHISSNIYQILNFLFQYILSYFMLSVDMTKTGISYLLPEMFINQILKLSKLKVYIKHFNIQEFFMGEVFLINL